MYDVIGDVHGHAGPLMRLLCRMGYVEGPSGWVPPVGRKAVFLGDLIDRGPAQVEVLRIVRGMVDAGHAYCVLGNHELNAIGWATEDGAGGFLRRHNWKNQAQHGEFLRQVGEGSALHRDLIQWFKTLPPALDLDGIRVVHAWWHEPYVEHLAERRLEGEHLAEVFRKHSPAWEAMDGLTKGHELVLPEGGTWFDHAGVERREVRTRWWLENPSGLRELAIVGEDQRERVPDLPVPAEYMGAPVQGSPVFVGHYWMSGEPVPMSSKLACLDWGVATGGRLVGYRWEGESEIRPDGFVWVGVEP